MITAHSAGEVCGKIREEWNVVVGCGWCVFLRTYGTTPPSWRMIPGLGDLVQWLRTMVIDFAPRPKVVGPLPNGFLIGL